MDKIPLFIINLDAAEMTQQCLDHLARHTDRSAVTIQVIDNGSRRPGETDRLKAFLQGRLCDELIFHATNLGFSRAVNLAVQQTREPIFCSINNDCLVEEFWLDAALRTLQSDDRIAAVCSNIYNRPARRSPGADGSIGQLNGAIMLFRRAAWADVGEFDSDHFSPAYGEELDWSYRALRKGYTLKQSGRSLAYHVGSYTANRSFDPNEIRLIRLTHRIQVRLFNWSIRRLLVTSWKIYYYELVFEIKNGTARLLVRAFIEIVKRAAMIRVERGKRIGIQPDPKMRLPRGGQQF